MLRGGLVSTRPLRGLLNQLTTPLIEQRRQPRVEISPALLVSTRPLCGLLNQLGVLLRGLLNQLRVVLRGLLNQLTTSLIEQRRQPPPLAD